MSDTTLEVDQAITIDGVFLGSVKPFGSDQSPSAIVKLPVQSRCRITTLGLEGDQQADRRIHGGPEKALHHYAAENYVSLKAYYPEHSREFLPGVLGENISTSGLREDQVYVGDIFELGSAVVQVTQPRSPCWKIDERMDIERLSVFIATEGISGWYYRVLKEGDVQVGDTMRRIDCATYPVSLRSIWKLYLTHRPAIEALEAALDQPALSAEWQHRLTTRLNWIKNNTQTTELLNEHRG